MMAPQVGTSHELSSGRPVQGNPASVSASRAGPAGQADSRGVALNHLTKRYAEVTAVDDLRLEVD